MIGPYRVLEGEDEQAVIDLLTTLIPTLNCAGTIDRWEKGWQENLEAFRKSGDVADLRPKYIRKHQPLRLNGEFIRARDPDAEAKWYEQFFAGIADKWLAGHDRIFEFGCGSCHNVAWLAKHFPKAHIYGLDWAQSTMEIVNELRLHGIAVGGEERFDFFKPTSSYNVAGAAIFTVGALEQTGLRWRPFLDWLRKMKPAICVHIEPFVEWYDSANPVDRTAIAAHDARGFLRDFAPVLTFLHDQGVVEILHQERTGFGSLWIEGYSQLIWRPL